MTAPPTTPSKFLDHPNDLGVVAVGFSGGQGKPGVDAAPTALINAGLLTQLSSELNYTLHHDNTVHNYASLLPAHDPPHRGMKNPRTVSAVTRALADQVYEHAFKGRPVLTLGGDHSIAIGTVAGTSRALKKRGKGDVGVIWVDAHADINTPESSDSGNVHGMPVAFLTGLAQKVNAARNGNGSTNAHLNGASATKGQNEEEEPFAWIMDDNKSGGAPPLRLDKIVYIGLRDVDRGEKAILRREGIKAFSMHDIDRHGIAHIIDQALAHLGPSTPLHLSFDVDALDPQWAPSTGTPVRGGLTLREGDFIAECVHQTGRLVAMDLVEVNPSLGGGEANGRDGQSGKGEGKTVAEAVAAEETVRAGVSLVRCALGDTLL